MSAAMRSGSSSAMAWVPPSTISRLAPRIWSRRYSPTPMGRQRIGVADEHQRRCPQGRQAIAEVAAIVDEPARHLRALRDPGAGSPLRRAETADVDAAGGRHQDESAHPRGMLQRQAERQGPAHRLGHQIEGSGRRPRIRSSRSETVRMAGLAACLRNRDTRRAAARCEGGGARPPGSRRRRAPRRREDRPVGDASRLANIGGGSAFSRPMRRARPPPRRARRGRRPVQGRAAPRTEASPRGSRSRRACRILRYQQAVCPARCTNFRAAGGVHSVVKWIHRDIAVGGSHLIQLIQSPVDAHLGSDW